jgi:hypothetical protein
MPEKFGSVFHFETSAKYLRNDSEADTADASVIRPTKNAPPE